MCTHFVTHVTLGGDYRGGNGKTRFPQLAVNRNALSVAIKAYTSQGLRSTMPYNYRQLDSHASATPKSGTVTSTYPPKAKVSSTKVKNPKPMVKEYK
jgi:hypothetical protein